MMIATEPSPRARARFDQAAHPVYTTLSSALAAGLDRPVALAVRCIGLHPAVLAGGRLGHELRLLPLCDAVEFDTLPVDPDTGRTAQYALDHCHRLVVTGVLRRRRTRGSKAPPCVLELHSLEHLTRRTAMVAATPAEIGAADATIDALRQKGGALREHLRAELRAVLQVAGPLSKGLAAAEELVLSQGVTRGQVLPDVNSRLSLCFYSDFSSPRRFLADAAAVLAPFSTYGGALRRGPKDLAIQADRLGGMLLLRPGLLSQSSGATCIIENLERLHYRDMPTLHLLVLYAAEQGTTCTPDDGRAGYEARCGLLLTSDRDLVLRSLAHDAAGAGAKKTEGVVWPFEVLSRLDLLVALDEDLDRPGCRVVSRRGLYPATVFPGLLSPAALHDRERALKVLVARLQDRFAPVSFESHKQPVRALMKRVADAIYLHTARLSAPQRDACEPDEMILRHAHTLRKLLAASARLDGRDTIDAEDIARTEAAVALHLDSLRLICQEAQKLQPPLRLVRGGKTARF